MDLRKSVRFHINLDEIVENTNSSEQLFLIKPMITKLIDYYQPIYNVAKGLEKEFREGKIEGDPKRNKELALWQGQREKALYEILEALNEILVDLFKLNDPLKKYHNELMGCRTEVKT